VTAEEKEFFEERAAIRQYTGGQSRVQAERGAIADLERFRQRRAGENATGRNSAAPGPALRGVDHA
jgi:hypothetical protein